ncbi:MAG: hypothetical protein AB1478_12200 [Nitrospirota bacterium]
MRRGYSSLLILSVFFIFLPYLTDASDIDIEKDLQNGLEQSKAHYREGDIFWMF